MHPDNIPYPPEWDLPEVPDWAYRAAEKELGAEFDRLAVSHTWLAEYSADYGTESYFDAVICAVSLSASNDHIGAVAELQNAVATLRSLYVNDKLEDQITKELDE